MQSKALLPLVFLPALALAQVNDPTNTFTFVYSSNTFETIGVPEGGGNTVGHSGGFEVMDYYGNKLWQDCTPNLTTDLEVNSDCWVNTVTFNCDMSFNGGCDSCSVSTGDLTYSYDADSDISFTGLTINANSYCGGQFVIEPGSCTEDSFGEDGGC